METRTPKGADPPEICGDPEAEAAIERSLPPEHAAKLAIAREIFEPREFKVRLLADGSGFQVDSVHGDQFSTHKWEDFHHAT